MKRVLAGLLGLLVLTGCANKPGLDPNGAVRTVLTELPAPTAGDILGVSRNAPAYTVGPFDELTVTVLGVEELSGDFTADAQGVVSVPVAGAIDASGMTTTQLAAELETKLARYVKQPEVTVNVKELRSRTVTVDGQVKDPGVYPATNNLSLMRAIATAKGTTVDADDEDVVVFRTVGGEKMAALYNLAAIRRGTYADPPIYPNDVIVVGDSPTGRMIRDLAPVIATPVVLILQSVGAI